MFYRAIGFMLLFVSLVTAAPVFAVSDRELENMPMDELTRLEIRLQKILEIRKLESGIKKMQSADSRTDSPAKPELSKFGQDSTTSAPALPKVSQSLPIPTTPPKPAKEITKPAPVSAPLPSIVAIWGEVEKGLLASLDTRNGQIVVKTGDKILSGSYTVTSITGHGVTVKDAGGKSQVLGFKPFEVVAQKKSGMLSQPIIPPIPFGRDSVFSPPSPGEQKRD